MISKYSKITHNQGHIYHNEDYIQNSNYNIVDLFMNIQNHCREEITYYKNDYKTDYINYENL